MPSLTQMRYIVSVYENQSFSLASQECHVSQPSLSMQIQKAEDELNVQIFDRNTKPVKATDKGYKLIQQMKVVLNESKRLEDLSKTQAGELSGHLDFAVIPTVAPYLLPKIFSHVAQEIPKVEISIFEQTTSVIIQNLKSKDLDAAILATPLNENDLVEIPLYYEPFYILAHRDHPLLKIKTLKETDISKYPVWLLNEGHCFRAQTLSLCSATSSDEVFKNIKYEGGSIHTLIKVVLESEGYTLIPHLALDDLPVHIKKNNVRGFKKPFPSREISLVFHKSQWKMDILDRLEKLIISHVDKNLLNPNGLEIMDI